MKTAAEIPPRISSTERLRSAVQALQAGYPDRRLVFRGQRRNLAPIPSAQRQIDDPDYRRAQAIFHSSWNSASSYLLPGSVVSDDAFQRLLVSMGLLQHYGFRSWFVDITSDPEIAAWFAVHQYVFQKILVHPKPLFTGAGESPYLCDRALALVSTARYEPCTDADGFLFVFGISDSLNAFSLSESVSSSALRVQRQKGGALIAPLGGQQLNSLLLATLVIDRHIVLPPHLNTRSLFPPPAEDEVYRKLLCVPYVVPDNELTQDPLLGIPGLIDVPLYIYDKHPDADSLEHVRVLLGFCGPTDACEPDRTVVVLPLSHLPKISYTTSIDLPNELLPPDGVNVALRTRESLLQSPDLSVWQSRRLWIQYPVQQMLVTFLYRQALYPLFRGLWVDIVGEHEVRLTPLFETLDSMITASFVPGDETRFREDFYFLTERLATGDAILKPMGSELHYEWKGWEERQHEDPLHEFRELYAKLFKGSAHAKKKRAKLKKRTSPRLQPKP